MIKTTPYDPAEDIDTDEAQVDLLNDALESGHAPYIANAIGIIARARGMTEIARAAGIPRETLYRALSEDADPQLATLMGIAKALGVTFTAQSKQAS